MGATLAKIRGEEKWVWYGAQLRGEVPAAEGAGPPAATALPGT